MSVKLNWPFESVPDPRTVPTKAGRNIACGLNVGRICLGSVHTTNG